MKNNFINIKENVDWKENPALTTEWQVQFQTTENAEQRTTQTSKILGSHLMPPSSGRVKDPLPLILYRRGHATGHRPAKRCALSNNMKGLSNTRTMHKRGSRGRPSKRPIKLLGSLMGMTVTGHFLHYYRWDAGSWQDAGCGEK